MSTADPVGTGGKDMVARLILENSTNSSAHAAETAVLQSHSRRTQPGTQAVNRRAVIARFCDPPQKAITAQAWASAASRQRRRRHFLHEI